MNKPIPRELLHELEHLDPRDLERVSEYVRSLGARQARGTPGSVMRKYAGSIPANDLMLMQKAIEEGCSTIDYESWKQ